MMIWDVLGQKEDSKSRTASLSGAQGVILGGGLSRMETVQSLEDFWLKEVQAVVGRVPTVIVGNKTDLAAKDSMAATILDSMGQKLGYPTFLASAKTGDNVEAIFRALGEMMISDLVPVQIKAPEKTLPTLAEVVDFIIQDFCAQYGG